MSHQRARGTSQWANSETCSVWSHHHSCWVELYLIDAVGLPSVLILPELQSRISDAWTPPFLWLSPEGLKLGISFDSQFLLMNRILIRENKRNMDFRPTLFSDNIHMGLLPPMVPENPRDWKWSFRLFSLKPTLWSNRSTNCPWNTPQEYCILPNFLQIVSKSLSFSACENKSAQPSRRCFTFDSEASGLVPGEATAALMLRPAGI